MQVTRRLPGSPLPPPFQPSVHTCTLMHTHAHSHTHKSALLSGHRWPGSHRDQVGEVEEIQATEALTHGTGGGGLKKQGRNPVVERRV